jgi:HSP90 family molecular chaperone
VPSKAPFDLHYAASEAGLRLFAKRVMIMDKCESAAALGLFAAL